MKLNVPERVALLQILPAEGDFTILKVLRDLQSDVGFKDEEHKTFKIRRLNDKGEEDPTGAQIQWDATEGLKEVEIKLGEKGKEIVKDALLGLDKTKKLRQAHYSLYEKFVQEKDK